MDALATTSQGHRQLRLGAGTSPAPHPHPHPPPPAAPSCAGVPASSFFARASTELRLFSLDATDHSRSPGTVASLARCGHGTRPYASNDHDPAATPEHALPQVVGLLVLLAAGQADGETLKQGIVGDEHIEPYNIVIIFMSQARCVFAVRTS